MTMTKPSSESKTAKRIWKSAERRSVIARTADIHVRARRGKTTQELHSDALQDGRGTAVKDGTHQHDRVQDNSYLSLAKIITFSKI